VPSFRTSESLDKLVRDTTAAAVQRFGESGLTAAKIAVTVDNSKQAEIIPFVSQRVAQEFSKVE